MKTCPICNIMFEPRVPHQEYDRVSCRRKGERQRARLRDKGAQLQTGGGFGGLSAERFVTMVNPTETALNQMAQVYLRNPTAMETRFFGAIPQDWPVPEGIFFYEQQGTQPRFWLMQSMKRYEELMNPTAKPEVASPVATSAVTNERVMAVLRRSQENV